MSKLLKFVLNFFAVLTALSCLPILSILFINLVMGGQTKAAGLWLQIFIPIALHRVPIMLGEFFLVRPYLSGQHVDKEFFKINVYVVFSLFLSSIICTTIFFKLFSLLAPRYIWPRPLLWGLITCIASLVAVAEVYIKNDYFMEKHLTVNPKKVTQLLSVIIIPIYLLSVAGGALYLYSKKSPIIFQA